MKRRARIIRKRFACKCEYAPGDKEGILKIESGREVCRKHGASRDGAIMFCIDCEGEFLAKETAAGRAIRCPACKAEKIKREARESAERTKRRMIISPEQIQFIKDHPEMKTVEFAKMFKVNRRTVQRAMKRYGLTRQRKKRAPKPRRNKERVQVPAEPCRPMSKKDLIANFIEKANNRFLSTDADRYRREFASRIRHVETALKANPHITVNAERDLERHSKTVSNLAGKSHAGN